MTHFNNKTSPVLGYDPYRGDFEFKMNRKKPEPKKSKTQVAGPPADIDKINMIMFMRGMRNIYNDFLVKPMVRSADGVNFSFVNFNF